jgi:Ca2+/H+ antiporter
MSLGVCCLYIPKLMFLSFFIGQMICLVLKIKNSDYD